VNLDYSKLGIGVGLPPLDGADPPPACPVCGSRQISPESDDGWPPREQWYYCCRGAYALQDAAEAPQTWEPYDECGDVSTKQALAWLRDRCLAKPDLAAAGAILDRAGKEAPPYPAEGRAPLRVGLPTTRGEAAPELCPVCGADGRLTSRGILRYTCGGVYAMNGERPGADGRYIATGWAEFHPCEHPPTAAVLRTLQARNETEWKSICEEALAALPKP
jgi:hypothetical protein